MTKETAGDAGRAGGAIRHSVVVVLTVAAMSGVVPSHAEQVKAAPAAGTVTGSVTLDDKPRAAGAPGAGRPLPASELRRRLAGRWVVDLVATAREEDADYRKMTPDQQKRMLDKLRAAPTQAFEFTDTTLTMSDPSGKSSPGVYTAREEGRTLVLEVSAPDEAGRMELRVESVAADLIRVAVPGQDGAFLLRRTK